MPILSRWSVKRFEQLDRSSVLHAKLLRFHPDLMIELIRADLEHIKEDQDQLRKYFRENGSAFTSIAERETKRFARLVIDYLHLVDKSHRYLPYVVEQLRTEFFRRAPDEMIEMIGIAGSIERGQVQYAPSWGGNGQPFDQFIFPSSFSIEHYVELFFQLYQQWSAEHLFALLELMLTRNRKDLSIYQLNKQEQWFVKIVVEQRLGKEKFLGDLIKYGGESSLELLAAYPQFTLPLVVHLIKQEEQNGLVETKRRLNLLQYRLLDDQVFDEFLSLFKKTNSDVRQRAQNYSLLLRCAHSTQNPALMTKVLLYFQKKLLNDQLLVLELFLDQLTDLDRRFHLQTLPENLEIVRSIFDLALNHLQESSSVRKTCIDYAIALLQATEYHSNESVRNFAIDLIDKCVADSSSASFNPRLISESYPQTRRWLAKYFVDKIFPEKLESCSFEEIGHTLSVCFNKSWRIPEIDSFLEKFFYETLPASKAMQSAFSIDRCSTFD